MLKVLHKIKPPNDLSFLNDYLNCICISNIFLKHYKQDTGGNCGSQSSTLIIRGIALNEIRFKEIFKVMFKEFRIALVVGVILAIANGLRIYVMYQDINIAFVIALSLIVTVILSKLIGCILPLVANQIGLDPAIMASPLITTIVDTCSILVYFNIAVHIFNL